MGPYLIHGSSYVGLDLRLGLRLVRGLCLGPVLVVHCSWSGFVGSNQVWFHRSGTTGTRLLLQVLVQLHGSRSGFLGLGLGLVMQVWFCRSESRSKSPVLVLLVWFNTQKHLRDPQGSMSVCNVGMRILTATQ